MSNTIILKNNLETFNKHHKLQLEYGNYQGGTTLNYLHVADNTGTKAKIPCTKSQAIDIITFLEAILKE